MLQRSGSYLFRARTHCGGPAPSVTRKRLRLARTATAKRKEAPGFPGASSFFLTLSRESDSVLRLNSDIVEEGTHERAKDERSYRYDHQAESSFILTECRRHDGSDSGSRHD